LWNNNNNNNKRWLASQSSRPTVVQLEWRRTEKINKTLPLFQLIKTSWISEAYFRVLNWGVFLGVELSRRLRRPSTQAEENSSWIACSKARPSWVDDRRLRVAWDLAGIIANQSFLNKVKATRKRLRSVRRGLLFSERLRYANLNLNRQRDKIRGISLKSLKTKKNKRPGTLFLLFIYLFDSLKWSNSTLLFVCAFNYFKSKRDNINKTTSSLFQQFRIVI